MLYDIAPLSKPRMVRSDKWKKRKCVLEYWAFRDEVKLKKLHLPESCRVTFLIPMPLSWSLKKKSLMNNAPHQTKPDIDNLLKGLMDAVFEDDAHIWDIRATKLWASKPGIKIEAV